MTSNCRLTPMIILWIKGGLGGKGVIIFICVPTGESALPKVTQTALVKRGRVTRHTIKYNDINMRKKKEASGHEWEGDKKRVWSKSYWDVLYTCIRR